MAHPHADEMSDIPVDIGSTLNEACFFCGCTKAQTKKPASFADSAYVDKLKYQV